MIAEEAVKFAARWDDHPAGVPGSATLEDLDQG